jgi:fructose-1,6-bisphosphatase/inositol monophosphatase family enzyme
MVNAALMARVEDAVRHVAAAEILPRWRQLAADDISHKTAPHDLVTVADRQAEQQLTDALPALLPGSLVVGEEAVAADPGVLDRLRGPDPVWIVDPVDGTANFVAGKEEFATMVALAVQGEVLASWIFLPRLGGGLMATARRGEGAHLDGEPLSTARPGNGEALRVATSQTAYLAEPERRLVEALRVGGVRPEPCRCAGLAYVDVARGEIDAVAFTWQAPWDHAAGLLLVREAGGVDLTAGGEPFGVTGGSALPFSVARDEPTARRLVGLMTAGARPAAEPEPGSGGER